MKKGCRANSVRHPFFIAVGIPREIYKGFSGTNNQHNRKRVLLSRGVSKRTLQYYDDEGLLMTERTKDNHRLYDRQAMERIWEILVYKGMGFELKEIREILGASETEKNYYFRNLIKKLEEEMYDLKGQLEFVSLIMEQGLPEMPDESSGITYTRRIAELRKERVKKAETSRKDIDT